MIRSCPEMSDSKQGPKGAAATILTDLHFWIPAVVLLAGLGVLYWMR